MQNKLEVSNLLTPFIKSISLLSDEVKNLLKLGLLDHINDQLGKHYFVNTFLHRHEKVRFKDIYYPVKAKYSQLTTDFENLDSLFDEYKYISIIGTAGSGKSTILKYLFLKFISNGSRIPILVNLRDLNESKYSFQQLLFKRLVNSKVKPSQRILKRSFSQGNFILLLDGFDEISSAIKQRIIIEIDEFIDEYYRNLFVITSRPGGGGERLPRFSDFSVLPLDNDDIQAFVEKMVDDNKRRKRILSTIQSEHNSSYRIYLTNPLLLSMFILTYENHPEIPEKKSSFYRNVFETLYSRHDGITKSSFPREKISGLQKEGFEIILRTFSFMTFYKNEFTFTCERIEEILRLIKNSTGLEYEEEKVLIDLETSISILIKEGLEYSFPHRSIQEYFAVLFISALTPNKKRKVLTKHRTTYWKDDKTEDTNFWDLLREVDYQAFSKYFLLPELMYYAKRLKKVEGEKLIKEFFKIFSYYIGKLGKNTEEGEYIFKEFFQFGRTAVIRFSKLNLSFHNLLNDIDAEEIIERSPELQDGIGVPPFGSILNDEIIEYLVMHNFLAKIEVIRDEIDSRILDIKKELKSRDDNIDDLIDI